jgi:hypothetical protein
MERSAEVAQSTFCLFDLCDAFEDGASELRFDPEAEVADGRDAERVVMARGARSLSEILGLRDADWEGGAPTGEFDADGTTAVINAQSNNGGGQKTQ